MNFLFSISVSSILLCLQWRPTSRNSLSAAFSFWLSRIVLSALYCFQSDLLGTRSLIWTMQRLIKKFCCSALVPSLLLMLMDWVISQKHSLTLLSFHCIAKPPFSYQIPMVSATHWLTPTPVFLAQRVTCWVSIWIELASAMTDFSNQKA